jgi:hypothetical protein
LYYRARYYDPTSGRFLNQDPLRFAGGSNFYRHVHNNPVLRKDPLGLWQLNIGGGEGLGGMFSLGYNSGHWNFAFYTGLGEGGFIDYDPTDSGGCHKHPGGGETRAHGGIGLGSYADADDSIPWGGPPNLDVNVNVPGSGVGLSWSPDKPLEPPHGVLGVGEGTFAGVGFHIYSSPSPCGCSSE